MPSKTLCLWPKIRIYFEPPCRRFYHCFMIYTLHIICHVQALSDMFAPIMYGGLSTFVGVLPMAFAVNVLLYYFYMFPTFF